MIEKLKSCSVQGWFSDFVQALEDARSARLPVPARGFPSVPAARAERSLAQTH
jgi:hypothetical protein